MAYKRREFFIDEDFASFLGWLADHLEGEVELVLNGDIFDFDNVLQLPEEPAGHVDWLARLRGLGSQEWMSRFKIERIIGDHPVWFRALGDFLARGHRAVFVIGNHDLELNWPSVQEAVMSALGVSRTADEGEAPARVSFASWFYVSGGDTFVSHGHQFDANCAVPDPVDPLILVRGKPEVRIPFGDLAGRYMLNGMGYFNPHASDNYIMSAREYLRFFFRYMVRTQPFLVWTWFWSAVTTLLLAFADHVRPAMRDPLRVEEKVRDVAHQANSTPAAVRQLAALSVAPACSHPIAILRELWLDRGLLFIALVFGAWQIVLHINIAAPISPLWSFVPLALALPPYVFYARSVKPTVFKEPLLDEQRASLIAKITGVSRAVFGHSHQPEVKTVGPLTYFNGGFWSPAFAEPECKTRIGTQSYVWIRPRGDAGRVAALWEWPPGAREPRPFGGTDSRQEPGAAGAVVAADVLPSRGAGAAAAASSVPSRGQAA